MYTHLYSLGHSNHMNAAIVKQLFVLKNVMNSFSSLVTSKVTGKNYEVVRVNKTLSRKNNNLNLGI